MNSINIMTPEHELWNEFVERLTGPEGIDLTENKRIGTIWLCDNTTDNAVRILESMPNIDIEKTLLYFEKHGGHCDCEILMNVDKTTDFSRKILGS